MKSLELKVYGVQEMNRQEMVETEGGSLIGWGIAVGVIYLLTSCVNVDKSTTINVNSGNGNSDQQTIGHGNGNGNGSGNNNGNKN